jgi:hypothetical protein
VKNCRISIIFREGPPDSRVNGKGNGERMGQNTKGREEEKKGKEGRKWNEIEGAEGIWKERKGNYGRPKTEGREGG